MSEKDVGVEIRRGKASDCKDVARMARELAEYQKMARYPGVGAEVLERDGFHTDPPLFYLFVAQELKTDKIVGYALYNYKYSTAKGKSMLLEDLYCSPEFRSKHVGSALFRAVVKEACDSGCQRMDFEVLDWNPARKFYERFGASDITEMYTWHMYRMTREDLENVSKKSH